MRRAKLILVLLGFAAAFTAGPEPSDAKEAVGDAAPDLIVKPLNGPTFNLRAQKSKLVLINFWATWCSPCRKELPLLRKIYQQYHSRGLEILALSIDRPRERDDVQKVALELPFPVAVLSEAMSNGFTAPGALPLTYAIDAQGRIRQIFSSDGPEISEAALATLLQAQLPAAPKP